MATDPTAMFGALLGTLQQSGNIGRNAAQFADQQQANKQSLALGALQLASAQAQQQQAEQYQRDVQSYYADPTLERLSALAAKYPKQAAGLKQSYDIMNQAQRTSALTQFGSLYNAADNGKVDLVRTQMQQIKNAEQAQGIDTSDVDQALRALDTDPDSAMRYIKGFAQIHLSAAGVDKFQIGDNENHFSQFGSGGIFDQRTGEIIQQPTEKPQYIWDSANSRFVLKPGTEGGGPASGGGGAAGAPSGRTQFGWTPRARNGGDNSDEAVDNKIAGMSQALGIAPDQPFPEGMSNLQIAQALSLSEGGAGSLADRNNNPANLTDGKGNYRKFPTREAGLKAAAAQVARNRARGQTTINTMVQGLPVGGSAQAQSGTPQVVDVPAPSNSADDPGVLTQGALVNAAAKFNATGQLPPLGMGKQAATQRARILNYAAQLAAGKTPEEILSTQAASKADQAALTNLEKQSAMIHAFESTALRNGALALRYAIDAGLGSAPIFNKWVNAGRKATGDPKIATFQATLDNFIDEYAKVLSGSMGNTPISDAARSSAHSRINSAMSLDQLTQVMGALRNEMENRRSGLEAQRAKLLRSISGQDSTPNSRAPSGFRILRVRPAQ